MPNKGRLADETRELFEDAGLDVRMGAHRALTASLGGEFEAIFVRAQDIPEFVADGAADTGVTGLDLVSESGRELETLVDLGFGRCRLVVAARDESGLVSIDDVRGAKRLATSFPRVAKRWLESIGSNAVVVPVSGAAEIAPHLGIADAIVDLTSSGSTLRVNGLHEIATILESTARLIARPGARDAGDPRARSLAELVVALESVLRARGQRYLMANVPRASLDRVRQVLPGINGPTVTEVMNGGTLVAVHAVVPSLGLYRTVADLKSLGATGILVTRIERLLP